MVSIIFGMNIDNSSEEATAAGQAAAQEQCVVEGQEVWGFALALHVFLPLAGMALLWSQKDIFSRVLLQLDRSCVSVFCPSFSKREKLLKWASARLPLTWSSQARTLSSGIPELWKDGSLLCTLINSVVPGACPNPHRHWKKPPLHAQALACKYLGLPPRFTDSDLSGDFTINLERNFICYLNDLQNAMNKWPGTRDEENKKYSSQYVARGMGLYTGEVNRKATFYIYSNASTKKRDNLLMYIRGPYGTRGKGSIPNLKAVPIINILQDHFKPKKTHFDSRKSFLRTISLDFHTLIGNVEKKTDEKEIPVKVDLEKDRAKITYIPEHSGIYEISIISDGELIKGCPFLVRVTKNESGCQEKFEADAPGVQDEKVVLTKRRVISKVIDCIDEHIRIDEDKVLAEAKEHLEITAVKKQDNEIFRAEVKLEKIDEDLKNNNLNNNQKPKEVVETTAKFLKNIINATQEQPKKNYLEIGSSSSGPQSLESQSSLSSSTSSICHTHIAPEVTFQRLPVEAKRKLFALHDSKNDCLFSESENEDTSHESRFRELSVLNILDSLKQAQEPYPLSSTVSLPNIPRNLILPSENHESIFKAKKEYWERLSSASSSKSSIVSCKKFAVSDKNLFNNIRDKKEYSKYENKDVDETIITKSVDDIISVKYEKPKIRYKSVDEELENCEVLTVEERKKILLKTNYEKERIVPKKLNVKAFSLRNAPVAEKNNRETSMIFTPISERIQKFDKKRLNSKKIPPPPLPPSSSSSSINIQRDKISELPAVEEQPRKPSPSQTIKSQFKKAIQYFKNLEESSKILIRTKAMEGKEVLKRRYSLDSPSKTAASKVNKSKGGSLNLSNISQRFSISNLYEDVLGNVTRRSSFKGTPNKSALVHSLASLDSSKGGDDNNRNVGGNNNNIQDETIRYNLFMHNSKAKVRKSIKNLFDVNY